MSLLDLALLCGRLGMVSFGGGVVVLSEMQNQLVNHLGVMSAQEFATAYALGQATPGPGVLYLIPIGYRVAGLAGALVAITSFVVPPLILTAIIGHQWGRLSTWPWFGAVNRTLTSVGVGLITAGLVTVARPLLGEPASILAFVVGAAALLRFGVSPTVVVFVCGGLGLLGVV